MKFSNRILSMQYSPIRKLVPLIDEAKKNDIPFYEDSSLAETLSKLEIGDSIPPELYEVVAEILVFVDKMDKLKEKIK